MPGDYTDRTMGYLLFSVLFAAAIIGIVVFRSRPSNDPTKSVDSFKRQINALNPERKVRGGRR